VARRLPRSLACGLLGVLLLAVGGGAGAAPSARATGSWRVPILMYHRIDTRLSAHDPVTVHLTVMAAQFEAQLRLLSQAGYRSLTLDELVDALTRAVAPPPRRAVLTFDDGYEDNYTVAFPLLRRYGWTAAFFVVTSTVGTRDHLTVAEIREMARAGMAIESHGQHHIDFSRLPLPVARGELERSRALIARWTGRPVRFFAYPAGRFTPALVQLLRQVGYRGAVTEIPGFVTASSHPFTLERVRVDHDDTLASFAHKLDLPLP